MSYIELKNVNKVYGTGEVQIKALNDASFEIDKGELVVILGPSGAGKSTFLRCLNALEQPTSGQVLFEGQNLIGLSDKKLDQLREKTGMVFQSFNLFPNMTVLKNITIAPFKVQIVPKIENEEKVKLANKIYETLKSKGIEAILDDREFVTMGAKIKDCKVLGTPYLIVLGDKQEGENFELENMMTGEKDVVTVEQLVDILC